MSAAALSALALALAMLESATRTVSWSTPSNMPSTLVSVCSACLAKSLIVPTARSTPPTISSNRALCSFRLLVKVSTLPTMFWIFWRSTELSRPSAAFSVPSSLPETPASSLRKRRDAGQELVDAVGILGQRIGEFLRVLEPSWSAGRERRA